ncbi:hypothetical protein [Eubacterium sp.]
MRKLYTSPEMEIIEFDTKDVITTSGVENQLPGEAGQYDDTYDDNMWSPSF